MRCKPQGIGSELPVCLIQSQPRPGLNYQLSSWLQIRFSNTPLLGHIKNMFSTSRTSFIFSVSEHIFVVDIMKMQIPHFIRKSFITVTLQKNISHFVVFTRVLIKFPLEDKNIQIKIMFPVISGSTPTNCNSSFIFFSIVIKTIVGPTCTVVQH